ILKPAQIFAERDFGVGLITMIENADRAAPSAGEHRLEHVQLPVTFAEVEDFVPGAVAAQQHAVLVESEEARLHKGDQFGEALEVLVAVVKIISEAGVREIELDENGELIFGFAKPAALIVESDLAADRARRLDQRTKF